MAPLHAPSFRSIGRFGRSRSRSTAGIEAATALTDSGARGLEDQIVLLRKRLSEDGLDAGAVTIHWHLAQREGRCRSVSSIWRVLARRGFVVPQPAKRPTSSFVRFEASLPNECWQSDVTHWALGDGTGAEIVNVLEDHSRLYSAVTDREPRRSGAIAL